MLIRCFIGGTWKWLRRAHSRCGRWAFTRNYRLSYKPPLSSCRLYRNFGAAAFQARGIYCGAPSPQCSCTIAPWGRTRTNNKDPIGVRDPYCWDKAPGTTFKVTEAPMPKVAQEMEVTSLIAPS